MFREEIRKNVMQAAQVLLGDIEIPEFSVEIAENPEHGDYAANVALLLAKQMQKSPLEIAKKLAAELGIRNQELWTIEVAPPGFLNFRLSEKYILEKLNKFQIAAGAKHQWTGKKITVEFTDPNPFKEFHIGHLYTNIVGEALSKMLEAGGAEVKRANYQGDVGLHVAKAIWGMRKKLQITNDKLQNLEKKSLPERIRFMGESYAEGNRAYEENEDAKKEITELNKKIFALDEDVREIYTKGRAWSLEYFENIYQRLGAKFDFYYFEREVGETGLNLVKENLAKGVFEKSDGAIIFPGEKYGLHRRVFINSEGLPTYEAKELGLAPTKYQDFPYDLSLIVTGSEVTDYFKVLLAALKEIDPALAEKTRHIPHGMVRLKTGKMSSRTGEVVRAEDLLNEVKNKVVARSESEEVAEQVALGAVKYSLLRVGIGKDILFDIDTSLNLEGDSGPYLQYTYARFKSILRKVGQEIGELAVAPETSYLERRLATSLLRFPEAMEDAANSLAPNILVNYLHALAMLANEFYHTHPVAQESDEAKKQFRIRLARLLAETLARGMAILGIAVPEKM